MYVLILSNIKQLNITTRAVFVLMLLLLFELRGRDVFKNVTGIYCSTIKVFIGIAVFNVFKY